jgi:hypothetical protein
LSSLRGSCVEIRVPVGGHRVRGRSDHRPSSRYLRSESVCSSWHCPLAFSSRNRIWAAVTLLAALLCLPLYLYSTFPGLFRWVFRNFVWNTWSIIGILVLMLAAALGTRSALTAAKKYA